MLLLVVPHSAVAIMASIAVIVTMDIIVDGATAPEPILLLFRTPREHVSVRDRRHG